MGFQDQYGIPGPIWDSTWLVPGRAGPAGRARVRLPKAAPILAASQPFSAVLEYQPEPWLCCSRLQGVVFNPSIQSVSRNRRRSIRHMLPSAPRRAGGCPSSCWGDPCPSVLPQPRPKGVLRVPGHHPTSRGCPFLPSAASRGMDKGVTGQRHCRRDSILSWSSFSWISSTAGLGAPQGHSFSFMVTVGLLGCGCLGCWEVCWIKDSHLTKAGL